jgi:integrase
MSTDLCSKNPVKNAKITKKQPGVKQSFTEDEVRTITNFAKSDKKFGIPILIMLNTGIRSGEMRALTINKIDFESGIVTVDTAVKCTDELGLPKNGKPRIVPLDGETLRFLKSKVNREKKYFIGDTYYVSKSGFRNRYDSFFKRLNKTLIKIGAEPIASKTPHATRHTFSTLLQKNGMPIAIVAELLGHSSTKITENYTHLGDANILSQAIKKYPLIRSLA